jgi:hypothetical protein
VCPPEAVGGLAEVGRKERRGESVLCLDERDNTLALVVQLSSQIDVLVNHDLIDIEFAGFR